MDVEKTMEFILEQQAKAEGQMSAIRKLIQAGARILVKQEEHITGLAAAQKDLAVAQKELARSQRVTETKLQGLIDVLRRGANGNRSRN